MPLSVSQVFFRCPRSVFCEYLQDPLSEVYWRSQIAGESELLSGRRVPPPASALEARRAFSLFGSYVSRYTARHLSYWSDIVNAFAGIAAVLETRLGCNITHGLPKALLNYALLWLPVNFVDRRYPDPAGDLSSSQFPS